MNHRSSKEAALQKLMDLLDEHEAEGLKGLKGKPAITEISVDKPEDGDDGEPSDFKSAWAAMKGGSKEPDEDAEGLGGDEEGDDLSDEEKAKISDLYHKHCAGK